MPPPNIKMPKLKIVLYNHSKIAQDTIRQIYSTIRGKNFKKGVVSVLPAFTGINENGFLF